MDNLEYIKYKGDKVSFEYKPFLNLSEFKILISEALDSYLNGEPTSDGKRILDNIPGFNYNLISGKERFYRALCIICVKDYTNELFEQIFDSGICSNLLDYIGNAYMAYETYKEIISKYGSVENIVENKISEFLNKIPEKDKLEDVLKELPKEWNKANKQYNKITKEEASKK